MVDLTEQDLLTGLLHPGAFARRVDLALVQGIERGDPYAVVVAELPPNADDGVLIEAARRLRDVTRSRDLVARSATAELAICCPGATEAEARAVARRVGETLGQPFELDGSLVGLRFGVGLYHRDAAVAGDTAAFALLAARAMLDVAP